MMGGSLLKREDIVRISSKRLGETELSMKPAADDAAVDYSVDDFLNEAAPITQLQRAVSTPTPVIRVGRRATPALGESSCSSSVEGSEVALEELVSGSSSHSHQSSSNGSRSRGRRSLTSSSKPTHRSSSITRIASALKKRAKPKNHKDHTKALRSSETAIDSASNHSALSYEGHKEQQKQHSQREKKSSQNRRGSFLGGLGNKVKKGLKRSQVRVRINLLLLLSCCVCSNLTPFVFLFSKEP